jgi:alpha-L-fucosidase
MSSPYPKDVVAKLAASCEKYGIKLGLYLSPWDRHEPLYGTGKPYDDFFCGQLEEILTRYGKLYSLWFDGANGEGPNGKKQFYDWERYYTLIRRHQPDAVIAIMGPDVRWVGNEAGSTRSSEWSVVPAWTQEKVKIAADSQQADDVKFRERSVQEQDLGSREAIAGETKFVWYPAEVDVSIRPGWFYHPEEDEKVKPLKTLLHFYETSVGGNAVLLLNIPPDNEGRINKADCQRLSELGSAIKNIFDTNLFEGSSVQAVSVPAGIENPAHPAANVLINDESYWRPIFETEQAEIEITLPEKIKLSHLDLREQIRESQRIEAFSIYAETSPSEENGENWQKIYSGTTVGFRKICRFDPVETCKLRLTIEQSRVYPTLRFVGVYLEDWGAKKKAQCETV